MSTSISFKSSSMNLGSAAVNLLKANCLGKTTGQEARYLRSVRIAERETQPALTDSDTAKVRIADDSPCRQETYKEFSGEVDCVRWQPVQRLVAS
jgi:hypothetical protein